MRTCIGVLPLTAGALCLGVSARCLPSNLPNSCRHAQEVGSAPRRRPCHSPLLAELLPALQCDVCAVAAERRELDALVHSNVCGLTRLSPRQQIHLPVALRPLARKSPSYFVWARDICAVQDSWWKDNGKSLTLVQVSVQDEENLPEDGSYQKSRTRATVDLSAWLAEKVDNGTKLTYLVKVCGVRGPLYLPRSRGCCRESTF